LTDLDVADHLGTRADGYAFADFRMAVAAVFTSKASMRSKHIA